MRDDELIRVDELAKNLCREMGYTGAEFCLEVVGTQNAVLSRAKQGNFTLYRESRPYPFVLDGLEEVHGALRISLSDAAVLRGGFMGKSGDEQEPSTQAATPAPVVVGALGGKAWVNKARERAAEIIKRQREKDLFPSQVNLGDEIATEFRAAGVVGADGKPLSGASIKRHALNGISSAQGKQLSTRTGRGK